jgi:hypothetical protein
MPDPLEPGHIPGQNPNTPERLHGDMKVGSGRSGSLYVIIAALLAALGVAAVLMFGSAAVDAPPSTTANSRTK